MIVPCQKVVPISKKDQQLQIAYGEVYIPNVLDSDREFMTPTQIRKTAHTFMKNLRNTQIDIEHNASIIDAVVVESFIARKDDPTFVEGAWVVGVHITSEENWDKVLKGELNGFSMKGFGLQVESELEIPIPNVVKGDTHEMNGHAHAFVVSFDDQGQFLGGVTSMADDHFHPIIKGTVTADIKGHNHRFAYIEGMINDD